VTSKAYWPIEDSRHAAVDDWQPAFMGNYLFC